MKDELEITKSCRNCQGLVYCRGTNATKECPAKNYCGFYPSEKALKLQCAKLILQRDKAIEKLHVLERVNAELNKALKKKNRDVSKLWKKLKAEEEK